MKLWIASDHAGYHLKESLKLARPEIEWVDLGTHSDESVHYPHYADLLCREILKLNSKQRLDPCGVLICGSGIGVSIAANRHKGIRAALCHSPDLARLSRAHNGANVLCLGSRFLDSSEATDILQNWVDTPFEGGRHQTRIEMMDK